jgi:transcriptional regulator with XRE-family HTH domain
MQIEIDSAPLLPDQEGLLSWLSAEVRARRVSQLDIAAASGVHQSQISRILAGKARRESANVRKLCKYATSLRQGVGALTVAGPESKVAIDQAVMRVWDGSSGHASALVELLEAVDRVQRIGNRKT